MKKKVLVVVCGLALLLSAGACKKKEQQAAPMPGGMPSQQQPGPMHGGQQPAGPIPGGMPSQPGQPGKPGQPNVVMPKGDTVASVPDTVKGKWKAVTLVIEEKATKKSSEYTVNLNSDLKVPNSNLKVSVGEFFPDFKMDGLNITSVSNEQNNPAVGIKVFEDGKQIFPDPSKKWGWLYAKFPMIHPFEHPKYSIRLTGGVKK